MITNEDIYYASYALNLAQKDTDKTMPNPNVGAVLVKDHTIIGYGNHEKYGTNHAEINALNMAENRTEGATCYVTLEPCGHFGLTPPCADALINAKISRVVYISNDPNPKVCGNGLRKMVDCGIIVEQCACLEHLEHDLNKKWRYYITHKRPYVSLKMGMSLDAKTVDKKSRWITSSEARLDVQRMRGENDAILTTADTVIADDPELTYRLKDQGKQPVRIVLDAKMRTNPNAKIYNIPYGKTILFTKEGQDISMFHDKNVESYFDKSSDEHINLKWLMDYLGQELNITGLMIEAGSNFANAVINLGLINELCWYTAPMILNKEGNTTDDTMLLLDKILTQLLITDIETLFIGNNLKVTGKLIK